MFNNIMFNNIMFNNIMFNNNLLFITFLCYSRNGCNELASDPVFVWVSRSVEAKFDR